MPRHRPGPEIKLSQGVMAFPGSATINPRGSVWPGAGNPTGSPGEVRVTVPSNAGPITAAPPPRFPGSDSGRL
jgi:hypothetical protein